jgi:CBS domain-containing protein
MVRFNLHFTVSLESRRKDHIMPNVRDILSNKPAKVHTIRPGSTVLEAINRMNEHGIGALVVTESDHVVGMFTERDVLRRVVGSERAPAEMFVAEVMTAAVATTGPKDDLDDVRSIMKDRRIRHLPVCDSEGSLVGLVSMGDLNAYDASNQQATIGLLNDYIYGRA